jgi:prepilin-type N-terminal cleavage/methylation domain-containing protein
MLHRRHGRGAFTLVELLVVIGIIAVLMSILLPALGMARRHAQDVICESNFRQFGMAIQAYVNNNNGILPQEGPDGSSQTIKNCFGPPNTPSATNPLGVKGYDDDRIWFNALPPLINAQSYYEMLLDDYHNVTAAPSWQNSKSIFTCTLQGPPGTQKGASPADTTAGDYFLLYGTDSTGTIRNTTGMMPSMQFKFAMTYVWNSKLTSMIGQTTDLTRLNIGQIKSASSTVLMTEKIANSNEYLDRDVQNWCIANSSVPTSVNPQGFNKNVAQSKACWTRFTTRHHGGGFLLFADGHVSWYSWRGVQFPVDQITPAYTGTSDANQYGEIEWSAIGPVD